MNIQTTRKDLADLLRTTGLSQYEFAAKHRLSYSSVNKFLKGKSQNPRINSLIALQTAIDSERASSKRRG